MEYLNNSKNFSLCRTQLLAFWQRLENDYDHNHITPILKNLHWLPYVIELLVTLLLPWKGLNGRPIAPSYITEPLSSLYPKRSIRSLDKSHISPLRVIVLFSVVASKLWNSLPTDLRQATSLLSYQVKTFLIMHISVKVDWFYKHCSCIALYWTVFMFLLL